MPKVSLYSLRVSSLSDKKRCACMTQVMNPYLGQADIFKCRFPDPASPVVVADERSGLSGEHRSVATLSYLCRQVFGQHVFEERRDGDCPGLVCT
jgi:hypothetical protein